MAPSRELPSTEDILDGFPAVTGPAPVKRIVGGSRAEWLHIAKQILRGEFVGADRGLRESLVIGLRGWDDRICRKALAMLKEADR